VSSARARVELDVVTDGDGIARVLDSWVARDPVRHTVLGTIAAAVRGGPPQGARCVCTSRGVAARSASPYPVALAGAFDDEERALLIAHLAALPDLAGLVGTAEVVDSIVRAFEARRPHRVAQVLYRLDALADPTPPPAGHARPAEATDRDLLVPWYEGFGRDIGEPMTGDLGALVDVALARGRVWLWIDGGRPVAMARRQAANAGSARLGPVYTPLELRGRGYASAVTAVATRDILDEGCVPVLFAAAANPVSNHIYQRLGYELVEECARVMFAPAT